MKAAFQTMLYNYCQTVTNEFGQIQEDRQNLLRKLGQYVAEKARREEVVRLVVICTHNSRRSHIGQLCLQAAAQWYAIPKVETYSGGTEATALNESAAAALQRVGFELQQMADGDNPVYKAKITINTPLSLELFSKTFDSPPNPTKDFAAIMVCSEADAGCPFVPGADARFAIPFDDPKNFDGTSLETEKYDECVHQIGREFFFAIHQAAELLKQP